MNLQIPVSHPGDTPHIYFFQNTNASAETSSARHGLNQQNEKELRLLNWILSSRKRFSSKHFCPN